MKESGGISGAVKLIISVLVTEGAGGIGAIFTYESIPTWYASLNTSALTPPNWIFGPMWITLYLLMGVALYMVWIRRGSGKGISLALSLFGIQLVLNVLWSLIFFGLHSLLFGAIEIVFLWFFILATIIEFYQVDKRAAYIMFPYIAWVTVATMLNISVLFANA